MGNLGDKDKRTLEKMMSMCGVSNTLKMIAKISWEQGGEALTTTGIENYRSWTKIGDRIHSLAGDIRRTYKI